MSIEHFEIRKGWDFIIFKQELIGNDMVHPWVARKGPNFHTGTTERRLYQLMMDPVGSLLEMVVIPAQERADGVIVKPKPQRRRSVKA